MRFKPLVNPAQIFRRQTMEESPDNFIALLSGNDRQVPVILAQKPEAESMEGPDEEFLNFYSRQGAEPLSHFLGCPVGKGYCRNTPGS
jgi:hypothetical protein